MRAAPILAISLFAAMAPAQAQVQMNSERALENYKAIMRGTKQLSDLTPIERTEVAEVDRLVRNQPVDNRTPYQKCRDAQLGGKAEPTELEERAIDLKCSSARGLRRLRAGIT